MPVLVGLEASCLVDRVVFEASAMSLRTDRTASARARGLDNELVPGKLAVKRSVARVQ